MFYLSLLLVILVCCCRATHFYGTVMTFDPKTTSPDGSVQVILRFKLGGSSTTCVGIGTWNCTSNSCGVQQSLTQSVVDTESSSEWCLSEGVMRRLLPNNSPFQMELNGGNWITGIINNVVAWRALTLMDLRNRSDTGGANRSPQTTFIPNIRVPSNCQRTINLLNFDPDGDDVRCRFGSTTVGECNPCNPPSVLSLSSSCSLGFNTTSASNEGPYAVQLVMEDYPSGPINLTNTVGSMETTMGPLSSVPLQFVLTVDPAVPSCTEGDYLPRFLPPTPADKQQLSVQASQTLQLTISTEALYSTVSELLVSGPINITVQEDSSVPGQFNITWTPTQDEVGEYHPVCFIAQGTDNITTTASPYASQSVSITKYHSEMRCVIVSVTKDNMTNISPAITLSTDTTPIATTASMTDATSPITTVPMTTDTTHITPTVLMTTDTYITPTVPMTTDTHIIPTVPMTTGTPHIPPTVPLTTDTYITPTVPMTTDTPHITPTVPMTTGTPHITPTVPMTTDTPHITPTVPMATDRTPPPTIASPTTAAPDTTEPLTEAPYPPSTTDPWNVVGVRVKLVSFAPLTADDITTVVLQQLIDQLVQQGLPADTTFLLTNIQ